MGVWKDCFSVDTLFRHGRRVGEMEEKMKKYDVQEWQIIYAAWCIKNASLNASDALTFASEAWIECGSDECPEAQAELDMEA